VPEEVGHVLAAVLGIVGGARAVVVHVQVELAHEGAALLRRGVGPEALPRAKRSRARSNFDSKPESV
jgi:hypothetical protein